MLDIKKILGEKGTIQFPLIYVGHENENWIKMKILGEKGLSLIYDGHKD